MSGPKPLSVNEACVSLRLEKCVACELGMCRLLPVLYLVTLTCQSFPELSDLRQVQIHQSIYLSKITSMIRYGTYRTVTSLCLPICIVFPNSALLCRFSVNSVIESCLAEISQVCEFIGDCHPPLTMALRVIPGLWDLLCADAVELGTACLLSRIACWLQIRR